MCSRLILTSLFWKQRLDQYVRFKPLEIGTYRLSLVPPARTLASQPRTTSRYRLPNTLKYDTISQEGRKSLKIISHQIQKLTSGYENLGNTLAKLGATTSILIFSPSTWNGRWRVGLAVFRPSEPELEDVDIEEDPGVAGTM